MSRRAAPAPGAGEPRRDPLPGPPAPPAEVRIGGVMVLVEAAALVLFAVAVAAQILAGTMPAGFGAGLTLVAAGVAALLVAGVRALRAQRRSARGPLVTWQILQAATATTFVRFGGADALVAVAAFALAVAVVVLLLTPRAVAYTTAR